MKKIETLLLALAVAVLFSFSLMAEDAIEKTMKEKKLTIPEVIQKILKEYNLVAIYAQEFNDTIVSGNKPNEKYFMVFYADKELTEKFWGDGDIVPMYSENMKAKICFDVKKKIIKFYWYDEWGGIHFMVYALL